MSCCVLPCTISVQNNDLYACRGLLNGRNTTQNLMETRSGSDSHHHGRTLLAFSDVEMSEYTKSQQTRAGHRSAPSLHTISAALEGLRKLQGATPLPSNTMLIKHLEEINIPVSMCPSYFNSSESERLVCHRHFLTFVNLMM